MQSTEGEKYVANAEAAQIIGQKYLQELKNWTAAASSVDDKAGNTEKVGKFSPTISAMLKESFDFIGPSMLGVRLLAIELFRAHKDFRMHLILAPSSFFQESMQGELYKLTGKTLATIFKLELEQIVRERGLKTVV